MTGLTLNDPWEQPDRHCEIGRNGQKNQVRDGCRASKPFTPIAVTTTGRKGTDDSVQEKFHLDTTRERRQGRGTELDPYRETPPVFTIVGSNTVVNKSVRNWIAAERVEIEGELIAEKPGPLKLLSNAVNGIAPAPTRAILIDFAQLESGVDIKTDLNQGAVADPLRPTPVAATRGLVSEHPRRRVPPRDLTNPGSEGGRLAGISVA